MSTGWLTVKKVTAPYPVFEVRREDDGETLLVVNEAVARLLHIDLGEALEVECNDRYAEGFADAQAEQYEALKQ